MSSFLIHLATEEIEFAQKYADFGFSDESEIITAALRLLQKHLAHAGSESVLEHSADLYAEIYVMDTELQDVTASAWTTLQTELPE
jgi:hypothetical protein